jgi:hypothetical protein
MTIKEFMNRPELSPKEEKAFDEMKAMLEWTFVLGMAAVYGPQLMNIIRGVA